MNISAIAIALITLVQIWAWHMIVIKSYDMFKTRIWPAYLACGLGCLTMALFTSNMVLAASLAIAGVIMLWALVELKQLKDKELKKETEISYDKSDNNIRVSGRRQNNADKKAS